ncbi:MAG: acyltransferase [Deltaproteobacteria bacterium]|nr:acyltransferase [Deltaproteobacteria bacterium]
MNDSGKRGVRIGFAQFCPALLEREANLEKIERLLRGVDANLLVLPELATTGYALPDRDTAIAAAEPIPGPTTERLASLACDMDGHLVVGLAEIAGDRLFNSAALIGPEGVVAVTRKTHLFGDEKDLFDPGNTGFAVVDIGALKVGTMICFDWAFPEAARTLARRGAQIIAHPSNLVLPYALQAMPVRSIENRVFAVTCNRWGEEKDRDGPLRFRGESMIISPSGEILASAPPAADSVRVVEIDPKAAENKWITQRNHLFEDRRPNMYEKK